VPTNPPAGSFNVQSKMPSKHMGVDTLTAAPEAYNLPGVPWTSFFLSPPGYAFHGTYWHDNFGNQMSHGCVNMRTAEALWLFRWTDPKFDLPIKSRRDWEQRGYGTRITIE
jgi:lipoprotein-anchoring transpeptidase ErfK/SrfK